MKKITINELSQLCCQFGIELAAVQAFLKVEAPRGGFLPSGRITILFERHIFYKLSGNVPVSKTRPDLSNPSPGGYSGGEKEWERLDAAREFADEAAFLSTSWGLGQIMGFNFKAAGFKSVYDMVAAFDHSEYEQVKGMLNFIAANHKLIYALKKKNWPEVAKIYNGPSYAKNNYDTKLQEAYKIYVA